MSIEKHNKCEIKNCEFCERIIEERFCLHQWAVGLYKARFTRKETEMNRQEYVAEVLICVKCMKEKDI